MSRSTLGGGPRTGGYLGLERKFVDYTYSAAVSTTITGSEADPATVLCLNASATGNTEKTRDGRVQTNKSCHIRGRIELDVTAAATLSAGRSVRIIVLLDTQTNVAQFDAEKVLSDDSTLKVHAFRELAYTHRFKILKDVTFNLNPTAAAGDGAADDTALIVKNFKWNFPLNFKTQYDGTTAVIGSVTDNSVHVMAIASGSATTLKYESRVRFTG